MNYNGEGVERNYIKARELFEKAADNKYDEANFYLGKLYYWADGVAEDRAKAKEYFIKAAEKGSQNAKDVLDEYYVD